MNDPTSHVGDPTTAQPMDLEADRFSDPVRPINVTQLVMAVAFLAMVAIWALLTTDTVSSDDLRWLLPIPFLSAGAVGLVASLSDVGRR